MDWEPLLAFLEEKKIRVANLEQARQGPGYTPSMPLQGLGAAAGDEEDEEDDDFAEVCRHRAAPPRGHPRLHEAAAGVWRVAGKGGAVEQGHGPAEHGGAAAGKGRAACAGGGRGGGRGVRRQRRL